MRLLETEIDNYPMRLRDAELDGCADAPDGRAGSREVGGNDASRRGELVAKTCTRCGEPGVFARAKHGKGGLRSVCRRCDRTVAATYRKSLRGRIVFAWHNMRERAGNPRNRTPSYAGVEIRMTREQFEGWAVPEFSAWMIAHPGESPTVDRVDSRGHYELGNIRVTSRAENNRNKLSNKALHAPEGQAWCSRHQAYLPADRFNKDPRRPNGLTTYCKACVHAREHAKRRETAFDRPSKKNVYAPEGQAWCPDCAAYLPTADFPKNAARFRGVGQRCRKCQAVFMKAYRARRRGEAADAASVDRVT